MLHLIIGLILIASGVWGITHQWYMFKDLLLALVPVVAIGIGVVAMLAGIRSLKVKARE